MTTLIKHKHHDLIVAWARGAQIQVGAQYKDGTKSVWQDIQITPMWNKNTEYRIKPEREYPKSGLSDLELKNLYCAGYGYDLRRIADAAIKQYLIDTECYDVRKT